MDKTTREIAESLVKAISAERDGAHFYLMAANSCEDPRGKDIFRQLADEELDHMRYLNVQYQALLKTGRLDSSTKLKRKVDLTGESPIFSPGIKDRIKDAHFEMTAISIGIQLELSAVNFYKGAADKAEDPKLKAFLQELVEWETGHYDALLRQQAGLLDDYRDAGGFSPF